MLASWALAESFAIQHIVAIQGEQSGTSRDIEKGFLNVEIDVLDRDCLHFLWMEKPFLLNATIRHHLKRYEECDPEFVQKLRDLFYVDDFVGGGGVELADVVELYSKGPSSRPGPVLGHFLFNVNFSRHK